MTKKTAGGIIYDYIWNVKGQLVEVKENSATIANYAYDPFGRRISKTVNGTKTYFLYNNLGLCGEYDESGNELRSYGYSSNSMAPLFLRQNGEIYYYLNDHLGTPQKIVSASGRVVWSAVYGAYGKATVGIEEVENNFRFPGQYFDEESGLHYNFFRYYDTETGRYISVDLARDGINFYAYCEADPLNFVDPYGLVTDRAGRECDSNELKKVFIRVKRGTGPKDPGHVFVQTPNYTYGFYPDGKYHFFNHGPGVYIDDTEVKGDLYYEYEAGPETVKKLDDAIMMDVINGLLGRPSTYSVTNIGGRNCAGKALEWIEKAGLPPPLSPRWPFVRPPWSSWGE